MAGTNSNYSVIIDAELELKKAQQQLNEFKKDNKLNLDLRVTGGKSLKETTSQTQDLDNSTKDLMFTYQQLRQVLDSVIDVTEKMYTSVKNLDDAQTEFKKVSDLNGQALDNYTAKLSDMGKSVARTGKPNRSEPVCCDGKAA